MTSLPRTAHLLGGGLLVLLVAVGAGPSRSPAGVIEGEVSLKLPRPRRAATRYPGARGGGHPVQRVPAIAYIVGPVGGTATAKGTAMPVMAQQDTSFAPAALAVQAGTTVSFPNRDPFFHNVFSYSSTQRFDLGRYPRGESKEVTFHRPGIVKVYCEVHEFMRAVVLVTENPFHAVVGEDGRFTIAGVPPGEYTLAIWHADLGSVERSVVVRDGGTVRVKAELG